MQYESIQTNNIMHLIILFYDAVLPSLSSNIL